MTKNIRITVWLVTIIGCLILAENGLSQSVSGRKEMFVDKLVKHFALKTRKPLTIVVNNIGEDGVVSVESHDADDVELQACSILYNENSKARIEWLKIEKFQPLAEDEVIFNNNTMVIDGHATANKRVVVHVSLPPQTTFTLYTNGTQVGSVLSTGTMVQNGESVASPIAGSRNYSLQAAILQAARLSVSKKSDR